MKLRKRNEAKSEVEKKDKTTVEGKKEKESCQPKKKKKGRERTSRKNKASSKKNKKTTETVEVIEIPPVVHCAISDVVSSMEEATKEELELKEECSVIFECNQCEGFFRSLGSYLNHKISCCCQSANANIDEGLLHNVYSWPFSENVKEEMPEAVHPILIDIKVEEDRS